MWSAFSPPRVHLFLSLLVFIVNLGIFDLPFFAFLLFLDFLTRFFSSSLEDLEEEDEDAESELLSSELFSSELEPGLWLFLLRFAL